jgi:quinol---cytochrome c reductase iron-sulfur subunit, bacillus type
VEPTTRRRFYISVIFALWGIITAALGAPALVYLLFPPKARREEQWFEIGDVGKLENRVPLEVAFRRNRTDGWKVISEKSTAWVVKMSDRQVVAYGPQCTHLGCAYHWDEGKNEFVCPCHSSIFSLDGGVVSGPAPRPLDRYDIKVEKNKLFVGRLRETNA